MDENEKIAQLLHFCAYFGDQGVAGKVCDAYAAGTISVSEGDPDGSVLRAWHLGDKDDIKILLSRNGVLYTAVPDVVVKLADLSRIDEAGGWG